MLTGAGELVTDVAPVLPQLPGCVGGGHGGAGGVPGQPGLILPIIGETDRDTGPQISAYVHKYTMHIISSYHNYGTG